MLGPIATADSYYPNPVDEDDEEIDTPVADRAFAIHGDEEILGAKAGKTASDVEPLPAYVNEARWVVDCPFCRSAQVCSPTDPRFLCLCGNALVAGAYLAIAFPPERVEIEQALATRPFLTAHWHPGETVDDLLKQNTVHGIAA